METTFITIHDLSPEAKILYSSDSIVDILGYTPDEVVNKSCWEFFHPEEIPYARDFHNRGVKTDKAAVLAYCQIKDSEGRWVGCECCFTIVYDVMVVCTSIYRYGMTSQKRAKEAPIVRRLFSSSPCDPRYHMLTHLSRKFSQSYKEQQHEPRAALFLNRFTRTLTIMYATNGIEDITGIPGEEMKGRSFYYCIQENCLEDAVKCLETAKGNDSIAYLRFWFRDPRQDDVLHARDDSSGDSDDDMTDVTSDTDNDEGGVQLDAQMEGASNGQVMRESSSLSAQSYSLSSANGVDVEASKPLRDPHESPSRTPSGNSSRHTSTHEAIFGEPIARQSSNSSLSRSTSSDASSFNEPIELEAVVSCTSDGLVVCLRRARPLMPPCVQEPLKAQPYVYANGLFAAPWATDPVYLPPQPQQRPLHHYNTPMSMGLGRAPAPFRPHGGPAPDDFMNCIRDAAVFAWALTGINGGLAEYAIGEPLGQSLPPEGPYPWPVDGVDGDHDHYGDRGDSVLDNGRFDHHGSYGDMTAQHAGNGSSKFT